jgi:hypothetical protein
MAKLVHDKSMGIYRATLSTGETIEVYSCASAGNKRVKNWYASGERGFKMSDGSLNELRKRLAPL